jgi:putative transposase
VKFDADIRPVFPCADNVIGLDYSSKALYIDNFGASADYPKYYRKMELKLKREQRKLSKRMEDGKNRVKKLQKSTKK